MTRVARPFAYIFVLLIVGSTASLLGLGAEEALAIMIFSGIITGALLYWRFRVAFAIVGIGILLGTGLLDVKNFIEFAGFDIIFFLISMMIVIGFLEERRFFEAFLDKMIEFAGGSAHKIVLLLMLIAALSAALVDEVTSILFITSTTLKLASRLRTSIVPLILMTVFATNIGSSATVVGNPIGVMIALRAGLTFTDFLRWATPISITVLGVCILISFAYFRGYLREMNEKIRASPAIALHGSERSGMSVGKTPLIVLLLTLTGLILHSEIENLLGLEKNAMLIGVPAIAAGAVLFIQREGARELLERRVDWWTLTFFFLFFASVGTLKFVGVTELLSSSIAAIGAGELLNMILLIGISVGFMTAVMDNVLAVALWIPIVADLAEFGVQIFPIWWAMLFAGTLMGNFTIIGSTANIVAVGMVERAKMTHLSLLEWVRIGSVVSLLTFALSLLLLYLQLPLMPI